jgi:hypothetical protein
VCVQYLRIRILLGASFIDIIHHELRSCLVDIVVGVFSLAASHLNVTSTGVPAGFTMLTVVNGVTSSVLVNSVGASTSFGAVATSVSNVTHRSAADNFVVRFDGMLAVAGGIAMLL